MIEDALKSKLASFPKLTVKDCKKLYELADILSEIESAKEDSTYAPLLSYYDTSSGIRPIIQKLPHQLQEKWTTRAVRYKDKHKVSFPPFSEFAEFIREMSRVKNDPGFMYENTVSCSQSNRDRSDRNAPVRPVISARKTEIASNATSNTGLDKLCPLHKTRHPLSQCKGFKFKPMEERRKFLKEKKICFRCLETDQHVKKTCKANVRCEDCGSNNHVSAMHVDSSTLVKTVTPSQSPPAADYGGESSPLLVSSKCTQVCHKTFGGKSCAKTLLVTVFSRGRPEEGKRMYAMIDDQSNRSLANSSFFSLFNIEDGETEYTISSCTGNVTTSGRRASGFIIQSLDGNTQLPLPTLIECDKMPDVREEIPTPDVARYHPHLQELTDHIPPLDPESDILLLIGRDLIEAHHVHDQKIGPRGSPYAQRLSLGWVIIGETCLGKSHRTDSVSVKKTYVLKNGRPSLFEPCKNEFVVHETGLKQNTLGASVFERTKDDVNIGLSVEDREFLSLMDKELHKGPSGKWVAPLPFRPSRPTLPNNRPVALKRAKSLHASTQKDSKKKTHMFTFMQKIFDNGHAELAPSLNAGEECWYLPIFGVYHPKKPDQIRGVFDSSAQCEGVSLNSVLLTGPDLTNSLLGILLRFRRERVAITADIEQMFYCFSVREDHRNYLRFLWYKDNDPNNELTEYRMTVHVFGNSPSQAIATYGLRRTAAESKVLFGEDVDTFVKQDFYVDDGITSVPTSEEAIDLMQRTKKALDANGRLHLHKIASNVPEVLNAFPDEDLSKSPKGLDFQDDNLPLQHSLGLNWDLQSDCFTFTVSKDAKPFTRRGILSVVNSIFDPLGFVAPVTLQGKFYLRRFVSGTVNWDDPLPEEYRQEWEDWRSSLMDLENLKIPRCYSTVSYTKSTKKTVHVYCDASEKAISAVAYLVTMDADQNPHVGFLLGKTKVAPPHGHTIPRLELCAAVLAVEIGETIVNQLGLTLADVQYHTDSRVVLGYINNKTRRFYVYVSNRVERIHRSSRREQWSYISTEANPADSGTRCLHAGAMQKSTWLLGPTQLHVPFRDEDCRGDFPLVNPHNDNEVRPTVKSMKVTVQCDSSLSSRFEKFSSWRRLVEAVAFLQRKARLLKQKSCAASSAHMSKTVESFKQAEDFVIKQVQHEQFGREIDCLKDGLPLPKNSRLLALNPFVDGSGIVRVGGRLNKADIPSNQKNPIILPGNHHVSCLLVGHHHEKVKHQGRHFTEGAVRAAGLWIIGGKRLVSSIIHKCVICRKLRGRQMLQQMADLPADRLQPGPPFTSVGVDAFGPWNIVTRRTRGGQANSKRWAIIFTCLTTRAIHIEVVEEMSSSSFINSLRRFVAIRGSVKSFRSDRGTNFVGATDSLKIDAINVEEGKVKAFLYNSGTVWIFNPPHSSHMGGVWERMIGVARRILDSLLLGQHGSHLTHEVLTTLMAEVCAIVNSRPLLPVSTDPDCPQILSPSSLLTQKFDPVVEPLLDFDSNNMYKAQWQRVQTLADMFWSRWKHDYLQTLQRRHKWQSPESNLKSGDVVLLQDDETSRGEWPMAIVVNAIKSEDGKVRKAEVRVSKEGKPFTYTRPICKLKQLISD